MCQAEAWSQFFCNLQIAFSNYYASNTNPQSVSSYSLRVLKSLHEIFRAPFLIIGLKHCQSSSPAWRKLSAKNTRVKHASKNTSYRSQLSVDFQNRFKRSWDLLLLKKNTLLPVSYHSYATTERFQTYQAQQTSLHHSYTQQLKAHAPQTNEWAKQHALRNKTARTIKGFLNLSQKLQMSS